MTPDSKKCVHLTGMVATKELFTGKIKLLQMCMKHHCTCDDCPALAIKTRQEKIDNAYFNQQKQ